MNQGISFIHRCGDDDVGRLLIAVLLKHHDLGHVVISLSSSDQQSSTVAPKCLVDVCKIVHQARTALIKVLTLLEHNGVSLK